MILDFMTSDFWKDIQTRVLATFSLSATGTLANAINPENAIKMVEQSAVTKLIEVFTLISYGMSILVAATVLFRFFLWYKDRNKIKK